MTAQGTPSELYKFALSVDCEEDFCKAKIGKKCITKNGTAGVWPHNSRVVKGQSLNKNEDVLSSESTSESTSESSLVRDVDKINEVIEALTYSLRVLEQERGDILSLIEKAEKYDKLQKLMTE